jgi:prepilin-type N-terminal cleavage/methylation domain-containing protein
MESSKSRKFGFTLIELLVVIAIIGLLATLSVIALSNARAKSRDSKRLADVKQMQTSLEMYYTETSHYPSVGEFNSGAISYYSPNIGTTTYMNVIPNAPTPNDGPCSVSGNGYIYSPTADESSYSISFCIGGPSNNLAAGPKCATPGGIGNIDCNGSNGSNPPASPNPESVYAGITNGNYLYGAGGSYRTILKTFDISSPAVPSKINEISVGSDGMLDFVISGNYLYAVASGASGDLIIFDISNPAAPAKRGTATGMTNPIRVAVSGNYAYVGGSGVNGRLYVINISDPDNPILTGTINTTVGKTMIIGIKAVGNRLYLAAQDISYLAGSDDNYLAIYDITNPSSPTFMSKFLDGNGGAALHFPTDLIVNNNYAYVANPGISIDNNTFPANIEIIDISSSTIPAHAGQVVSGQNDFTFSALSFKMANNRLYMTGIQQRTLDVFNLTTPAQIDPLISIPLTSSWGFPWFILGISGGYAQLSVVNSGFQYYYLRTVLLGGY